MWPEFKFRLKVVLYPAVRGFPCVLQFSSVAENRPLSKSKAKANIVTLYLLRKKEFWPWKCFIAKEVVCFILVQNEGIIVRAVFSPISWSKSKAKTDIVIIYLN